MLFAALVSQVTPQVMRSQDVDSALVRVERLVVPAFVYARQLLLEWVDESDSTHHHMLIWKRRIERRIEPHDLECATGRDGNWHPA